MAHCGEDDLALQPCVAVSEPERHMFICENGAWVSTASMPPAPAFKFQQQVTSQTSSSAFSCAVNSSRESFAKARVPAPASTASEEYYPTNAGCFQRAASGSRMGPRMRQTTDSAQAQNPVFGQCDGRPVVNWNFVPQNATRLSQDTLGAASSPVFHNRFFNLAHTSTLHSDTCRSSHS